jgi:hypothetical protein
VASDVPNSLTAYGLGIAQCIGMQSLGEKWLKGGIGGSVAGCSPVSEAPPDAGLKERLICLGVCGCSVAPVR